MDGVRRSLQKDFSLIFHVDLGGDLRDRSSGHVATPSVFGITLGVGITVAVKKAKSSQSAIRFLHVPSFSALTEIYEWLNGLGSVASHGWSELHPTPDGHWLSVGNVDSFKQNLPIASKSAKRSNAQQSTIFKLYTLGITTNRDNVVYDFASSILADRVSTFAEGYNAEVHRYARSKKNVPIDQFVSYNDIIWSRDLKQDLASEHYVTFDQSQIVSRFIGRLRRSTYTLTQSSTKKFEGGQPFCPRK